MYKRDYVHMTKIVVEDDDSVSIHKVGGKIVMHRSDLRKLVETVIARNGKMTLSNMRTLNISFDEGNGPRIRYLLMGPKEIKMINDLQLELAMPKESFEVILHHASNLFEDLPVKNEVKRLSFGHHPCSPCSKKAK